MESETKRIKHHLYGRRQPPLNEHEITTIEHCTVAGFATVSKDGVGRFRQSPITTDSHVHVLEKRF